MLYNLRRNVSLQTGIIDVTEMVRITINRFRIYTLRFLQFLAV